MKIQSMFPYRAAFTGAVLAVAASTATPIAVAQSPLARVNVPFAFENGTTHLPAGTYTVSMLNEKVMALRGDAKSSLSMVQTEARLEPTQKGRLVFHRYGDHYILREIWTAGRNTHLECPKSKLEKELQISSNQAKSSGVEFASVDVLR